MKERKLWNNININTEMFTSWYKKIGQGMGATLLMSYLVITLIVIRKSLFSYSPWEGRTTLRQ